MGDTTGSPSHLPSPTPIPHPPLPSPTPYSHPPGPSLSHQSTCFLSTCSKGFRACALNISGLCSGFGIMHTVRIGTLPEGPSPQSKPTGGYLSPFIRTYSPRNTPRDLILGRRCTISAQLISATRGRASQPKVLAMATDCSATCQQG